MKNANSARTGSRLAAGRSGHFTQFHRPLRGLLGLAMLMCGSAAQAYTQDSERIDTPWVPDVIEAIAEYVPDPSFNHGQYYLDHFAGPNSADEVGAVTAQMSNGDTVVAGLVPYFGGVGTCNNGTALCRLGLVRYNSLGVRVAWSNPGIYGFHGNQYVIFPSTSVTASYQYIRDIKIKNDEIYVMVDTNLSANGGKDVRVLPFGADGSPVEHGLAGVFGFGSGADFEDFYGAQIAIISSTAMVVTATGYDSVGPYIAANRIRIEPDGSLSQDPNWGEAYGGGTVNRIVRYYAPGSYCGQTNCDVTASYAMAPVASATGSVYIAGSIHISGANWDAIVLKISSTSGVPIANFNGSGWSRAVFDEPSSSLKDLVAGLYVYQDDVYVAAQVAQKCHNGIGLAKLNGATGGYQGAFGVTGKIVFGGQGNAQFCIAGNQAAVPNAISATGGRIGVVGYQAHGGFGGGGVQVDPMLAVVNAVNGEVLDFASHPLTRSNGTRYGDAVLYGVYGGSSPTSTFTVSGNGRDESAGNTLSYVTGRFVPVSSDRIFANGFGGD